MNLPETAKGTEKKRRALTQLQSPEANQLPHSLWHLQVNRLGRQKRAQNTRRVCECVCFLIVV